MTPRPHGVALARGRPPPTLFLHLPPKRRGVLLHVCVCVCARFASGRVSLALARCFGSRFPLLPFSADHVRIELVNGDKARVRIQFLLLRQRK